MTKHVRFNQMDESRLFFNPEYISASFRTIMDRPIMSSILLLLAFVKYVFGSICQVFSYLPKMVRFIANTLFLCLLWLSMSHQIIPMLIVSIVDRIESKLNLMLEQQEQSRTLRRSPSTSLLNALHNNKMTLK